MPGYLDDLIQRISQMARPRTHIVSHESSNLDSIANGFAERPAGISFARAPHERLSSPLPIDATGRRGIVYATVNGPGVDYNSSEIARLLDEVGYSAIDRYGTADNVVPDLRKAGVQWVNNWNSIGNADELHVLDPQAVQIRRIFELPNDRSYQFQRPQPSLPLAYGPDDYSHPIRPVRR